MYAVRLLQYHNMLKLNICDSEITWPGNVRQKPEGLIIPTFLKVMTIIEQPFVYARSVQDGDECNALLEEEPCPWFNNSGTGEPISITSHVLFVPTTA